MGGLSIPHETFNTRLPICFPSTAMHRLATCWEVIHRLRGTDTNRSRALPLHGDADIQHPRAIDFLRASQSDLPNKSQPCGNR